MSRIFSLPRQVVIDGGVVSPNAEANFYLTGTTTPTNTYTDDALGTPHANPVIASTAGVFAAIYLDPATDYKLTLNDENQALIYTEDPILSALTAADVAIVDAGGFFAATEVEAALQDIGNTYLRNTVNRAGITANYSFGSGGLITMDGESIRRPNILDYTISHTSPTATATVILNVNLSNSFVFTLTENTTVSITGDPASGFYGEVAVKIIQDGSAGAYTVTWPAEVLWPGGTAPVISTGNDAVDSVSLWTIDGGTTWYGNFSQAYS